MPAMKKAIAFLCLLVLVGCQAGRSEPVSPQMMSYLTQKSPKQVARVMGKPTIVRTEEPYQLWAYRQNGCSTLIYFNEQGKSCYVDQRGESCTRAVADAR